jgi:hypothetical protein
MTVVRNLDGEWASIPLEEIAGAANVNKQNSIGQAAKTRGFRVQTTVQAGRLYARLVVAPVTAISNQTMESF